MKLDLCVLQMFAVSELCPGRQVVCTATAWCLGTDQQKVLIVHASNSFTVRIEF